MKFENKQQVLDLLNSTKGQWLIRHLNFWQGRAVIITRAVVTEHVNVFESKINCGKNPSEEKLLKEINSDVQEKLLMTKGCEGLDDNFINACIKYFLAILGYYL